MTRTQLHLAMAFLEGQGFVAPQKAWQCCTGCGCAALPEGTKKFAFYHDQNLDDFKRGGSIMLTFGETLEEGKAICAALEKYGVPFNWDGTLEKKIEAYPS